MKNFLRYNSRHRLYFPGDWKWPELNPIVSSSHTKSGKRTRSIDEPYWMFRLRQRIFCFAGKQRCPSRGDWANSVFKVGQNSDLLPDTWDRGPDGNRTCSYCGSIHPDDLMLICRKVPSDERYGLECAKPGYKYYLKQPGVQNASQGAIKFYMHHVPKNPSLEDQATFSTAVKITRERFQKKYMQGSKCDAADLP